MKLKIASIVLVVWVSIITAVVLWLIIGTAPWESPKVSVLCEDALIRRRAAEEALRREYSTSGGVSAPLRVMAEGYRGAKYEAEIEILRAEIAWLDQEIMELCLW